MEIGIRELKQRLSEVIEIACQGEDVVVTHRGMPKVVIKAIPGAARIQQGIEEGWITPAKNWSEDPFKNFPPLERNKSTQSSEEILRADRDDE
jgi:prevent-host-death family protein